MAEEQATLTTLQLIKKSLEQAHEEKLITTKKQRSILWPVYTAIVIPASILSVFRILGVDDTGIGFFYQLLAVPLFYLILIILLVARLGDRTLGKTNSLPEPKNGRGHWLRQNWPVLAGAIGAPLIFAMSADQRLLFSFSRSFGEWVLYFATGGTFVAVIFLLLSWFFIFVRWTVNFIRDRFSDKSKN